MAQDLTAQKMMEMRAAFDRAAIATSPPIMHAATTPQQELNTTAAHMATLMQQIEVLIQQNGGLNRASFEATGRDLLHFMERLERMVNDD